MGKKHKKKVKPEKTAIEGDAPSPAPSSVASTSMSEPPLKLVLKVGGTKSQTGTNESYNIQENTASDASTTREQHPKKKKKKKKSNNEKHSKKKDKTATKREYESYESHETNSQEDDDYSRDGTTMEEDNNDDTVVETEEDMETESAPPKAKKALLMSPARTEGDTSDEKKATPANRPVREKDAVSSVSEKSPLQKVLENLQRTLQRKDVDCFFAWPVNDVIAPGYSSIITQPMDFSSMKKKIDNKEYQSLDEYRNDFNLMCNNATIYNGPDTIYYKAAKKLLAVGAKIMKKERLMTLKRAYGHYEEGDAKLKSRRSQKKAQDGDTATEDSSGVDGEAMETDDASTKDQTDRDGDVHVDLEEETAEEIIEQVLQAAKGAKDRLTARAPKSKIGFLRQDKNGTTTLNILNPDKRGQQDSRVVNLGMLTPKLTHGTGSVPGFKEDKRNKVTPVSYLNYGAYSSFAPSFDSTYSNISKEESDLLYAAYGDKTAYQYAQSLQDYVKDCGDYAVDLVDNLLDMLTNGEHTKANKVIDEKRKEEQKKKEGEEKEKKNAEKGKRKRMPRRTKRRIMLTNNQKCKGDKSKSDSNKPEPEFDFDSLKSLSDLGIDMSFLPTIEKEIKKEKTETQPIKKEQTEIETKLNSTSALIGDLEKTQNERMSCKPQVHLSYTPGPSDQECDIAEKLTQQLLALTSKAAPGDVSTTAGVRKAMGVNLHPADSSSSPDVIEEPSPSTMTDTLANTNQPAPDDVDKNLMDLIEGSDTKS
ncbi:LOW QUALITY PROTEIN: bromodomain-containing protein 7-like [Amphiura filiformis]|uniref:LOW QUALITY PROTEIN: bromodomain-containing protein 7-like n=1 Tax=Amphiura filiformis TaxID=82378 RepID=UPI003B22303B